MRQTHHILLLKEARGGTNRTRPKVCKRKTWFPTQTSPSKERKGVDGASATLRESESSVERGGNGEAFGKVRNFQHVG